MEILERLKVYKITFDPKKKVNLKMCKKKYFYISVPQPEMNR